MADPPRPYSLWFEHRPHYLYAFVESETITSEIALGYYGEIAKETRGANYTRLLVHRQIPQMLPDGPLFFVAAEASRLLAGIKTAFVNPFRSNQNLLDFSILVGKNRGSNYGAFDNDLDAERWLQERSDPAEDVDCDDQV